MFNDANGTEFKKVVIACGYTDGRLGINGLASLTACIINWILTKKESSSFSAADAKTGAKQFCGKGTGFSC